MFNRVEIKQNAKEALKHFYLFGLLACLLYALISGSVFDMWDRFQGFWSIFRRENLYFYPISTATRGIGILSRWGNPYYYITGGALLWLLVRFLLSMIRAILGLLYQVFVVHVLEVGLNSFFLKNRHQDTGVSQMLMPFQNGYMNVVKVLFLRSLYVFLWGLLFVIPGIIKSYEYFFVPYLLAENTEFTVEQALSMSRKMTEGEKWKIFIFQLSFFGWFLLATILGGFGWILVMPYYEAAKSELYVCLKERKL